MLRTALLSVLFVAVCVGGFVNQTQSLVNLYEATNGPMWDDNDGWLVTDDFCSWEGITCDDRHRVVEIRLSLNNLSGTLPESFDLPWLVSLFVFF